MPARRFRFRVGKSRILLPLVGLVFLTSSLVAGIRLSQERQKLAELAVGTECSSTVKCPTGYSCSQGFCVKSTAGECTSDYQCFGGEECRGGVCKPKLVGSTPTPIPTPWCNPGTTYLCKYGCTPTVSGGICTLTPTPNPTPFCDYIRMASCGGTCTPTLQGGICVTPKPTPTRTPTPVPTAYCHLSVAATCQFGPCVKTRDGGYCPTPTPKPTPWCNPATTYACKYGCIKTVDGGKCLVTPSPTPLPTPYCHLTVASSCQFGACIKTRDGGYCPTPTPRPVTPSPTSVKTCTFKSCSGIACINGTITIPISLACPAAKCADSTDCNIAVTCNGKPVGTKECNSTGGYNYCKADGKWYSNICPLNTACSNGECKPTLASATKICTYSECAGTTCLAKITTIPVGLNCPVSSCQGTSCSPPIKVDAVPVIPPPPSSIAPSPVGICSGSCSASQIQLEGQSAGRIGYTYSNGEIAGFYEYPPGSGKYYPIAENAGGPTSADLNSLALLVNAQKSAGYDPNSLATLIQLNPLIAKTAEIQIRNQCELDRQKNPGLYCATEEGLLDYLKYQVDDANQRIAQIKSDPGTYSILQININLAQLKIYAERQVITRDEFNKALADASIYINNTTIQKPQNIATNIGSSLSQEPKTTVKQEAPTVGTALNNDRTKSEIAIGSGVQIPNSKELQINPINNIGQSVTKTVSNIINSVSNATNQIFNRLKEVVGIDSASNTGLKDATLNEVGSNTDSKSGFGKIIYDSQETTALEKTVNSPTESIVAPKPQLMPDNSLENFDVFLQYGNNTTLLNNFGISESTKINSYGSTLLQWGCGPSTALNILRLAGYDVTFQQVLDSYFWKSAGSSAGGVLLNLRRNGYPIDTINYGMENRITDALELNTFTGTLVYEGKAGSVDTHIAAFKCDSGDCYSLDSYLSDGKPMHCFVEDSRKVNCQGVIYNLGPTYGSPGAFYPVIQP